MHAARSLPTDGTQLHPSPTLAEWRDEAAATPLTYPDGHVGWIVTRHQLAQELLADPRFTRAAPRSPMAPGPEPEIDDDARRALADASLEQGGEGHARLRRAITPRFSVKAARGHRAAIAEIVRGRLSELRAHESPVDLTAVYAEPISADVHCLVMGVPDSHAAEYSTLFVGDGTLQQQFDFTRRLLALKRETPADDLLSDLVAGDLTRFEAEGLALAVLSAGRDSVAHLIATSVVALLSHPEQWAALCDDPGLITSAVEEFVRVGSLFLTLSSRTALEDVEIDGVVVAAGQSVSVSPAAANRDERRFDDPERFDVTRDAFGHLGFGHGIHACVGQQVARVAIAEAIAALVLELPGLRLVGAEQLRPLPFATPTATHRTGAVVVDLRPA